MSLEEKLAENTAAVKRLTEVMLSVASLNVDAPEQPKEEVHKSGKAIKASRKKQVEETSAAATIAKSGSTAPDKTPQETQETQALMIKAKAALSAVAHSRGEDKAKEILAAFKAEAFSEVPPHSLEALHISCEEALEVKDPKVTVSEVKELLIAIAGNAELGNNRAIEILNKHGVEKMSELKPSQYGDVKDAAEKMLEEAGVTND